MGRRLLLVGGILALAAGTTGAAPSQTRKAPVLTPGERKALHIVSVRAFGDEPNGLVVIATFGGNIQRALGHGHLKTAAVAMILQPKAGSLKSAGLVTEGGGVVGQTLRKTRSPDVAVARKGNRIVFLVHGPGESQVGKILVKTVVAAPSGAGVRTTQALRQGAPSGLTDEEWALWVDAVAWSQSDVDWFATAPTDDCASLASLASWVRRTRDYQADISGQLAYWDTWLSAKIAKLKQKAAPPPARTLDDLFAVIGTDETPAVDPQAALRQLERDQAIVRRLRARAAFAVKTATTTLAALNAKIAANCGGKAPPPLAAFKVTLDAGYDHTTPGPPGIPRRCAPTSRPTRRQTAPGKPRSRGRTAPSRPRAR